MSLSQSERERKGGGGGGGVMELKIISTNLDIPKL